MGNQVLALSGVSKCFRTRRAEGGLFSSKASRSHAQGGVTASSGVMALSEISFSMGKGEAVAILGRNGAGKSTLLQIIAGTLRPSTGDVRREGRLSAMLELGFGFNPDFTGRENIALAASIYGIGRAELKRVQPEIEAFSEIGDFLDRPLRTYSTGMVVRLAFAIITVTRPQVLIIDEALSVGDIFFQAKCVRWMENYLAGGGTLLCASHDFTLIQKLCSRALVLHGGKLVYDGLVNEGINCLYRLQRGDAVPAPEADESSLPDPSVANSQEHAGWLPLPLHRGGRTGDRRMELLAVESTPYLAGSVRSGEWVKVRFTVLAHQDLRKFDFGLGFRDRTGQLVGGFHSFYSEQSCGPVSAGERVSVEFSLQLNLKPQEYLLLLGLAINHSAHDWEDLDCLWDCASVAVVGEEHFWGVAKLPMGEIKLERQEIPVKEGAC